MEQSPGPNKPPSTFNEIYTDFHPKILGYVGRLVGWHDAEDVTQEVFLKVNAALANFRGESNLSTWIYRIATNAAMDHLRKTPWRSLHAASELTDDALLPGCRSMVEKESTNSLDSEAIRMEMNECIRGIVDGLPENYRTVLALSEMEEFTNLEISQILSISVDTVKIRLHRARARLKKELETHCNFYRDERNEFACDRKTVPLKFLKN
ncbi:MAG: sigma-70 family RNA polymerase sigma factor [Nitrospiraceae bacterium]|nr:sigma-70 family RNA polymerase sigma factor [Nitrospiraceae bacterium]